MRINRYLIFLLWLPFNSVGQDNYSEHTIDSLFTQSVSLLINKDYAQADKVMSSIILRIDELDQDKIPKVYNNRGLASYGIGEYAEGIKYYKLAIEAHEKNGADTLYAQALFNLGMAYKEIGADSIASSTLHEAVYRFRKLELLKEESGVLNSLGNLYRDARHYERSKSYLIEALNIRKRIHYKKGEAYSNHGLGMLMIQKSDYQSAKKYFHRALFLKDSLGLKNQAATTLAQLGVLYMNINDCDSAEYYFKKSFDLRQSTRNPNKLKLALNNLHLGQLNLHCGDTISSIEHFLEAERELTSSEALKDLVLVYEGLLAAFRYEGNYKEALRVSLKLLELRKQILDEDNQKELANLSIDYDVKGYKQSIEVKALENDYLKSRNRILIGSSFVLVLMLIIVVVLYRKNLLRKKEIEDQNNALSRKNRSIITLHDELFHRTNNFLSLLRGMLINDRASENEDLLNLYLSRLDAMSEVQKHLIIARDESFKGVDFKSYALELIEHSEILYYSTRPISIRHNLNDLDSHSINYQIVIRIGIILNELINNSVKHSEDVDEVQVSIDFKFTSSRLEFYYSDSGGKAIPSSKGKGLKLIKDLLYPIGGTEEYSFNEGFGAAISISLEEKKAIPN